MLKYLREEHSKVCFSFLKFVGDPAKDGLVHGALLSHIEVVSVKDVSELLHGEVLKLFTGGNLLKVISDIAVGLEPQSVEEVGVGEVPDADAVAWAELLPQEVAAGFHNVHYIEQIGCHQQLLYVVRCHRNRVGVCKLNDELHHGRRRIRDVKDLFVWV